MWCGPVRSIYYSRSPTGTLLIPGGGDGLRKQTLYKPAPSRLTQHDGMLATLHTGPIAYGVQCSALGTHAPTTYLKKITDIYKY